MQLLRYDFNEPQCGKDQCDRGSAAPKTIIRSFVDAENDLISAEDVFEALHYGKGMKNAAVSVIKVADIDLQGKKIPGIQDYHSVQFNEKKMIFWRYYDIGNGVSHPYNHLKIEPAATIIKGFSETCKVQHTSSNSKKTKRSNRELCALYFCMEPRCSCSFEKKEEYEFHMMSGEHRDIKLETSMDAVKGIYVEKLQQKKPFQQIQTISCRLFNLRDGQFQKGVTSDSHFNSR